MEDSSNSGIDTQRPAANVQEGCDSSGSEVNLSGDEHRADDGFEESEIDQQLLKQLRKGAAKLTPKQREIKKKKDDIMTLHSETQRIVRESRVNIPYHQPSPKSINAFLARASMKQQQYKVLRGVRDSRKAKVLEDLLEKTRIVARKKTLDELDEYSDSDEDWSQEVEDEQSLRERLRERFDQKSLDLKKAEFANGEEPESSFDKISVLESDQSNVGVRNKKSLILGGDVFTGRSLIEMEDAGMKPQCLLEIVDSGNLDDTEVGVDIHEDSEKGQILNSSEDIESNLSMDVGSAGAICDKICDKNTETCKVKDIAESNRSNKHFTGENRDQTSRKERSSANDGHFSRALKKRTQLALASCDSDNIKPCLSGNDDTFITLEQEPEVQMNTGVAKLLDRLHKHSTKREKQPHADVDIRDVKGTTSMEELKLNTFVYHMEVESDSPLMKLDAPGAKLVALKEQLQEKIKAKRELARQKRQEAYDFDNEEAGYEEEEEAEMSEHSDTDVEDDEFIKQFAEDEEEIGYERPDEEINQEEKEKNPFADEEADEEDEEGCEEEDDKDEEDVELKLDVSEDDEEKDIEEMQTNIKHQKGEEVAVKSDIDSFKEPVAVMVSDKPFSIFGRQSGAGSSQFQSGQKNLSMLPPIEDSQDLYGTIPEISVTQTKHPAEGSNDFKFLIEDSQSNMLDADGYLRTEQSKGLTVGSIEKEDFAGTEGNMNELLGLCSGRFAQSQTRDKTCTRSGLFADTATEASTQNTMDELMGLCSGVFVDQPCIASDDKGVKRRLSDEDSDEDSLTTFTDDELPSAKVKYTSEDEGDTDNEEREAEEQREGRSGDNETANRDTFAGFTVGNKHGKIRPDFVEEEAELSGSEYDSDENLDIPEEEDIMEMEEGDRDAANMDQVKLRDEVGRVHLKRMIDEDKREVLRFQEMYLPDGDLHSEGGGRTRRFKWNNMDDNSHQDIFEGSDNEHEPEEVDDADWRKERYEREKFLKEQQEKARVKEESSSQFLQLGKVFLKKKVSMNYCDLEKQRPVQTSIYSAGSETSGLPNSFNKLPQQKKGSFLARSKKSLAKIAEMTKPTGNPSAGAKSSGKFTFSVISPEKDKDEAVSQKSSKGTAHIPTNTPTDKKLNRPPVKKRKIDSQSSLNDMSIFNHF